MHPASSGEAPRLVTWRTWTIVGVLLAVAAAPWVRSLARAQAIRLALPAALQTRATERPPPPEADTAFATSRVTLVIMNFMRPENVRRIISDALGGMGDLVGEVILVAANNEVDFSDLLADPRVQLWAGTHDIGLHARFAAATLARYPRVVIQDDDVQFTRRGLRLLLNRHARDPAVLHGTLGRYPTATNPYSMHSRGGMVVGAPITLTVGLVGTRDLFGAFFRLAPSLEVLQAFASPRWNGEDILLALAVLRRNGGRVHVVHSDLAREGWARLESDHGISTGQRGISKDRHARFRALFTELAYQVLGLQLSPPNTDPARGVAVLRPALKFANESAVRDLLDTLEGRDPLREPLPENVTLEDRFGVLARAQAEAGAWDEWPNLSQPLSYQPRNRTRDLELRAQARSRTTRSARTKQPLDWVAAQSGGDPRRSREVERAASASEASRDTGHEAPDAQPASFPAPESAERVSPGDSWLSPVRRQGWRRWGRRSGPSGAGGEDGAGGQ